MGNDIETVWSTGSDYWAGYIGREKNHMDLNDTPEPKSLPIDLPLNKLETIFVCKLYELELLERKTFGSISILLGQFEDNNVRATHCVVY